MASYARQAVRAVGLLLGPAMALGAVAALPPVVSPPAAAAPPVAAARPIRIMPLGDSITLGIGTATFDSYRRDLHDRLTAAGVAVDFVGSLHDGTGPDRDHEGHPGWTIVKVRRSIDTWIRTYRPDVVLLHLGTNDMRADDRAAGADERLAALIDRITRLDRRTQVMVATLVGADRPAFQHRIDTLNRALPAVVAAAGPRVHLVDQSSVDGRSLRDNLHPNDYGAAQMSWNFYRALEPVLSRGARWPVRADPYRVRRSFLCRLAASYPDGSYVGRIECSWHRWRRA